jgi:hypothetical protein
MVWGGGGCLEDNRDKAEWWTGSTKVFTNCMGKGKLQNLLYTPLKTMADPQLQDHKASCKKLPYMGITALLHTVCSLIMTSAAALHHWTFCSSAHRYCFVFCRSWLQSKPGVWQFWSRSLPLDKLWEIAQIRSSPFWDIAWCWLVVDYWHLGHLWCHLQESSGPITNIRCATFQKSTELSYTAAEVQNLTNLKSGHIACCCTVPNSLLVMTTVGHTPNNLCYKQYSSKPHTNAEAHQNYFTLWLFCWRQRQPQLDRSVSSIYSHR